MTLPAPSSTIFALVAYLQAAIGGSYQVHGIELPAGWTLTGTALIQPDGGAGNVSIPMVEERFTIHSYGATFIEAIAVDLAVFGALHRAAAGKSAAITGGSVALPTAYRVMGPLPLKDPGTEWPRVLSAYMVTFSEWALDAVPAAQRANTASYWPEGFWQEEP